MDPLRMNYKKLFSLRGAKRIIVILIAVLLYDYLLFPLPVLAQDVFGTNTNENLTSLSNNSNEELILKAPDTNNLIVESYLSRSYTEAEVEQLERLAENMNRLPANPDKPASQLGSYVITAYNSEVGQCDNDPCTTANGFNVCQHGIEDTVAANFLPFGTKIKIPDLFGDRIFVVRDRMNSRYQDRIDVWMLHKADALKLGVRLARVEVLD